MDFGLINDYGNLTFIANEYNSRGWHKLDIPKEYRCKENFEMYCYMRYMGIDAAQMFLDKIKELSK